MTASPMNFSTVPPWRSSTARTASKQAPMSRRNVSGSSLSPSAVEPVTSVNRTVTVLRIPRPDPAASSAAPQRPQNRKSSGTLAPQAGQSRIRRVYVPVKARTHPSGKTLAGMGTAPG
jgi:hypothetical protein